MTKLRMIANKTAMIAGKISTIVKCNYGYSVVHLSQH